MLSTETLIKARIRIVCYLPVGTRTFFPSSPQWLPKYVKIQIFFPKAPVSENRMKSNQIFQKLSWRKTSYSFVCRSRTPCFHVKTVENPLPSETMRANNYKAFASLHPPAREVITAGSQHSRREVIAPLCSECSMLPGRSHLQLGSREV